MRKLLIVLAVAIIPWNAQAASGNDVLKWCTAQSYPEKYTVVERGGYHLMCQGYVRGVMEGIIAFKGIKKELQKGFGFKGDIICLPKGVTNRQLVDMLVERLRKDIANRHNIAAAMAVSEWANNFKCN